MIYSTTVEVNFDGLIGPTHNFAGLGPGNLASWSHRRAPSNPRAAARQGLAKMVRLRALEVPQALLPPQPRPNLALLRRLGFSGDDAAVLATAQKHSPHLLATAMSSSSMWTANAATVCPSADAGDRRVHFTPANLVTSLHRASETDVTATLLKRIFPDPRFFVHHDAVPSSTDMGDEGAANHTRFCDTFGDPGVQMFVYGSDSRGDDASGPKRFVARQSKAAGEVISRLHHLDPDRVVFAKQNPRAIDAGVFHNDVIAVGHRQLLLCHEQAFEQPARVMEDLRRTTNDAIQVVQVPQQRVSLDDAVSTYLFNSQIVTTETGETVLIAPEDCRQHAGVNTLLGELVEGKTFDRVEFVDLRESMDNGGGPACLRLRVVLTPEEQAAVAPGVWLTDRLEGQLEGWIDRHYRDSLTAADLADPALMTESYTALDELTELLELGSVYEFQR
ncbi:N-succinylarginine dihydrolase [Stieleria sp. ICT_E10.1]|uniref:N-succinylarginine dihydrolase n=1 Tax=Stieleria sedimenti TaxID=2976331 RepID=UPI002180569E|nr:N-succinylarginine dihydrolase [Stieleria sedimenti]MCS7465247.1 N-succinylarginine dihydrolase [Stieleria sedimenti]